MTKEGNGLLLHETFLGAKLQLGIAEPLEYLRSLASSSAMWEREKSRRRDTADISPLPVVKVVFGLSVSFIATCQ